MAAPSVGADCDSSAVLRVLLRNHGVAAAAFSEELDLPDGIEAQGTHAESHQLIIAAQARAAEASLLSRIAPVSKELKAIADEEMLPAAREVANANMDAALDTVWTMYEEAGERAEEAEASSICLASLGSVGSPMEQAWAREQAKEMGEEGEPMDFLNAEELTAKLRNTIQ